MGSIQGLHTALSGMQAARAAIDTSGNNVANAHTDGYTRQRIEQVTRATIETPQGRLGTGVEVADVARLRDAFLDERVRTTGAAAQATQARAEVLQRAETVLGEPDDGISEALSQLWDRFEDLGNDPDGLAAREQVIGALENLAGRFNGAAADLADLRAATERRRDEGVEDANRLIAQIAEVGDAITRTGTGEVPNDLADQRDALVDELSALTGARAAVADDGTFTVSISGQTVVTDVDVVGAVATDPDGAVEVTGPDPATPAVASGELAGLGDTLADGGDLEELTAELDELAVSLRDELNDRHRQGWTLGSATAAPDGGDLLDGDRAANLVVSGDVGGPEDLAAALEPAAPGDGRNAQALAELRQGAGSIAEQAREMTGRLASQVSSLDDQASAQRSLAASADHARRSAHGVSIDEEMVSLMTHQRAFEAASRVTTTIDAALDTLINRTGVVGR